MSALGGIIAFFILSIVVGKRIRRMTPSMNIVLIVVALLQTIFILYYVFTMPYPEL